jgi:hypothetical protein
MLAVVAVIIAAVISWPQVLRHLIQGGLQEARKHGTNLTWNGLSTGFSSAGLDSLTVWIPGPRIKGTFAVPISIEMHQLSIALNHGSLLTLSPAAAYSTKLYGGYLLGYAHPGLRESRLFAQVQDVEIGKHPQLSGVGVRGGMTNGAFEDILITARGVEGGTFSLRVRELALPTIDAVKTLLRTDDLGTVDLDAEGTISPTKVDVKGMRLSSMFGTAVGSVSASEHLSQSPTLTGRLEVSLSEDGLAKVGPWLQLIPNAGLGSTTPAFVVSLTTVPCSTARSTGTVVRLPSGCVKLGFSKQET